MTGNLLRYDQVNIHPMIELWKNIYSPSEFEEKLSGLIKQQVDQSLKEESFIPVHTLCEVLSFRPEVKEYYLKLMDELSIAEVKKMSQEDKLFLTYSAFKELKEEKETNTDEVFKVVSNLINKGNV